MPALAATHPGAQRLLFGAIGFPLSIFLVTITEASAFTASLALFTTAMIEAKARASTAYSNLVLIYIGNACGLLLMASLVVAGGMYAVEPCWHITQHKLAATWSEIFFRGIGGGWLVCLAVFTATAADDIVSKFASIWLCISTYVMCGWEHSLANLFFMPVAILSGAPDVTWSDFIYRSLIPSTLGNMVGGIIMVGCFITAIHGTSLSDIPLPWRLTEKQKRAMELELRAEEEMLELMRLREEANAHADLLSATQDLLKETRTLVTEGKTMLEQSQEVLDKSEGKAPPKTFY